MKQLPSWITDNVPSSVIEKIPVVVIEKALDAADFVDNWFEENNLSKQEVILYILSRKRLMISFSLPLDLVVECSFL